MKITLLVVGKTDVKWVKEGLELYISRLKHYVPFSLLEIPELKNVSSLGKEQIKLREGDLILKSVKPSDMVVLMDERGSNILRWSSLPLFKAGCCREGKI